MEKVCESIYRPNQLSEYDPFLLKNMNKVIDRMVKAVNEREKIVLYGCCDVDAICGVSLLMLMLKYLNADVEYYISDEIKENNSMDSEVIKNHIKFLGAELIITVGCELDSLKQEMLCKELGIDVIITSYLKSDKKFNSLIINPNQQGCRYENKNLSSSGVTFKLAQAIANYYNIKIVNKYIDLAMLGTVASKRFIIGENKIIYDEGLKYLPKTNNYGLKAIIRLQSIKEFDEDDINKILFTFTPTVNAIGRMDNARIVVELLTTSDEYRAEQIAKYLNKEVNNNLL